MYFLVAISCRLPCLPDFDWQVQTTLHARGVFKHVAYSTFQVSRELHQHQHDPLGPIKSSCRSLCNVSYILYEPLLHWFSFIWGPDVGPFSRIRPSYLRPLVNILDKNNGYLGEMRLALTKVSRKVKI